MEDVKQFIANHRHRLLQYLEDPIPRNDQDLTPAAYVEQVLNEWSNLPDACKRTEVLGSERTFWYVLYTLEELAENPTAVKLPFEHILINNLKELRILLESEGDLPSQFFATRPGEYDFSAFPELEN